MTLVPAGRCCGNHSHQPDGMCVGERGKDGSGSVLPGLTLEESVLDEQLNCGLVTSVLEFYTSSNIKLHL